MWLIERGGDGQEPQRIIVPPLLVQALVRWYSGKGLRADEEAGIMLVQQARIGGKWIACACKGPMAPPPILTPAYLCEAETYYLRRLTARNRPEHETGCPFFRDQATNRITQTGRAPGSAAPPSAYFAALRPAPEKLAQRPANGPIDDRTRQLPTPRLARLLWRLIDLAGVNHCHAHRCAAPPSISNAFNALISVTRNIEIAPGIELARAFFTHPQSLRKGHVFSRLQAMEKDWPSGHAPQAFLALFAQHIQGTTLYVADGPPLTIANRIQSPSTGDNRIGGPYLVLILVGQYPETHGYAALRGYAQPIYSGQRFVPVDTAFARDVMRALLALRAPLDRHGIDLHLEKPLFDILTPLGPCRPDLLLEARSRRNGQCRQFAVDIDGQDMHPILRTEHRDQAARIAPVLTISPPDLDQSRLMQRLCMALNL